MLLNFSWSSGLGTLIELCRSLSGFKRGGVGGCRAKGFWEWRLQAATCLGSSPASGNQRSLAVFFYYGVLNNLNRVLGPIRVWNRAKGSGLIVSGLGFNVEGSGVQRSQLVPK